MKILCFPKTFLQYSLCDPCFYPTIQKFRLLYNVILLHATILGMTLKGLGSICFQQISFLVDKAYLRKSDACNHNKKCEQSIIVNFLKSSTAPKVLFALILVNKGLE